MRISGRGPVQGAGELPPQNQSAHRFRLDHLKEVQIIHSWCHGPCSEVVQLLGSEFRDTSRGVDLGSMKEPTITHAKPPKCTHQIAEVTRLKFLKLYKCFIGKRFEEMRVVNAHLGKGPGNV
mmetsp:Transcript_138337/g.385859  ORF Transcript_138337/g.385859 Transcript_138337/m.385859 type:complete len:122 (+) Transcript_138337:197-562(+)